MATQGVYCIRNTATGMRYIGSAAKIETRWRQHRRRLNNGQHENTRLLRSWRANREGAFAFEILEEVDDVDHLIEVEQRWIDSFPFESLYNARRLAHTNRGVKMPAEYVERLRERMQRTGPHPALLEGLRRSLPLRPPQSIETREKRRRSLTGLKRNPEQVAKMRERMLNQPKEERDRQRMKRAIPFILTSPSGEEIRVANINDFCRERGLHASLLIKVATGVRPHHRGWLARHAAS